MEEKKQKRSGGLMALVVLLLIITIVSVIIATYGWAKYQTAYNGNTSANVANWNITFSKEAAVIEQYQYVNTGMIAPGTEGHYEFNIEGDSDVAFKYILKIDNVTNQPHHLRFYALNTSGDKVYFTALDNAGASTAYLTNEQLGDTDIQDNTKPHSGKYVSAFAADANKSLTVYWEWPYNAAGVTDDADTVYNAEQAVSAYDAIDVADSKNTPMTFTVTLVATQIKPANN